MQRSLASILVLLSAAAAAADSPGAGSRPDLLSASPSTSGGAVAGLVNPAAWALTNGELAFWTNDRHFEGGGLDNWGLGIAGGVGFSVERRTYGTPGGGHGSFQEYNLGFSEGNRAGHFGAGWRWAHGDARESGLAVGHIVRPSPKVAFGTSTFWSARTSGRTALVDVGYRPLSTDRVTLFGDYFLTDDDKYDKGSWSLGGEFRPVRGLQLGARLFGKPGEESEFTLSVGLTVDELGSHLVTGFDRDWDRGTTTALLRVNSPQPGVPLRRMLGRGTRTYVPIDLSAKRLGYRKDVWFDEKRVAWIDLLRRLDAIREDDDVDGVVLTLSRTRFRPSVAWELRTELGRLRAAGKEVIVRFDDVRQFGYWVASEADVVWMDPHGSVILPGVAFQRTYLKGLMDKLGLGFEELRFYRFKSVNETYARADMSEEDAEQLGRIADVLYETVREDVCEQRGLTPAAFDEVVEKGIYLRAEEARESGLVDEIGRGNTFDDWLKERGGVVGSPGPARKIDRWGRPPTIAVVYAQGASRMDAGFKGRALSKHIGELASDSEVAAVVFRADSPGGFPLPADLVADALERVKEAGKPVVVSQGDVAASAGYSISLPGERIYTTPVTFTGSIGVIGGWVWDDGFGEKTGLTGDGIQRGSHADLLGGIRIPFLGVRLPRRPLSDSERERANEVGAALYDEFVSRVAEDRELEIERVREIAEGRVWLGPDALDRDLVDEVGTLGDAIADAKERAGITSDAEVLFREYPPRRRFRLPKLGPDVPGLGWLVSFPARAWSDLAANAPQHAEESSDYSLDFLQLVAESPGQPLFFAPPAMLPLDWVE